MWSCVRSLTTSPVRLFCELNVSKHRLYLFKRRYYELRLRLMTKGCIWRRESMSLFDVIQQCRDWRMIMNYSNVFDKALKGQQAEEARSGKPGYNFPTFTWPSSRTQGSDLLWSILSCCGRKRDGLERCHLVDKYNVYVSELFQSLHVQPKKSNTDPASHEPLRYGFRFVYQPQLE